MHLFADADLVVALSLALTSSTNGAPPPAATDSLWEDHVMNVDARTATAADFDAAAQSWANQTWFWGIAAAVIGFLAGWFALIPAVRQPPT